MKTTTDGIPTEEFLGFLKGKFPNMIFHNSNVFFRDLHYGVMAYLGSKGERAGYNDTERAAADLAARLVDEGVFTGVDHQSWRVNYPKFALPRVEKPAAAPAAAKAPAAPAAATPASAPVAASSSTAAPAAK